MIKRILKFKTHDWKHIYTLSKTMISNLIKLDFLEAYDSFMWIKVHLTYDSNRMN